MVRFVASSDASYESKLSFCTGYFCCHLCTGGVQHGVALEIRLDLQLVFITDHTYVHTTVVLNPKRKSLSLELICLVFDFGYCKCYVRFLCPSP